MTLTLPALPYDYHALEPVISAAHSSTGIRTIFRISTV